MVLSLALLKPLLALGTLLRCPSPSSVPLRSTSAFKSKGRPSASLFLSPIQSLAGLREDNVLSPGLGTCATTIRIAATLEPSLPSLSRMLNESSPAKPGASV
jgi:hypothetical protein